MQNKIEWQKGDGSFSPTPTPAPSHDWRGEVQRNIRGSGFGNDPQAQVREASAMRPSPNNFSGGGRLTGGFGPNDPRNTDEYWRRVAREPREIADANRARALQGQQQTQPFDPSWEGTVKRVSDRADAKVRNNEKPRDLFAPRDQNQQDFFRDFMSQLKGMPTTGAGLAGDQTSSFDTSFQSVLQLLED